MQTVVIHNLIGKKDNINSKLSYFYLFSFYIIQKKKYKSIVKYKYLHYNNNRN